MRRPEFGPARWELLAGPPAVANGGSCGSLGAGAHGEACPSALAHARPSMSASADGGARAWSGRLLHRLRVRLDAEGLIDPEPWGIDSTSLRLPGLRGQPRTRPNHLAGDKACGGRPVFAHLSRRRIQPAIPPRQGGNTGKGRPRGVDPDRCPRRNAVERRVGGARDAAPSRHTRRQGEAPLPAPTPPKPKSVTQKVAM